MAESCICRERAANIPQSVLHHCEQQFKEQFASVARTRPESLLLTPPNPCQRLLKKKKNQTTKVFATEMFGALYQATRAWVNEAVPCGVRDQSPSRAAQCFLWGEVALSGRLRVGHGRAEVRRPELTWSPGGFCVTCPEVGR